MNCQEQHGVRPFLEIDIISAIFLDASAVDA